MGMLRNKLSSDECKVFEWYNDGDEFIEMMKWMQQDPRGGLNDDLHVLLSANVVDYQALSKSQPHIILWHGTGDTMVPYTGAEWFTEQLPGAALHTVERGTHEGCMFLLHSSIVDSLKTTLERTEESR